MTSTKITSKNHAALPTQTEKPTSNTRGAYTTTTTHDWQKHGDACEAEIAKLPKRHTGAALESVTQPNKIND